MLNSPDIGESISNLPALLPVEAGHDRPTTRVVARQRPLSDIRVDLQVPAGMTIAEIFFGAGIDPRWIKYYQCWLCDDAMTKEPVFIPHENWLYVRPRQGVTVTFRVAPHGAGGQKGALGIVLRVVVLVIAAVTTALTYGSLGPAWSAALGGFVPASGKPVIAGLIPSIKEMKR